MAGLLMMGACAHSQVGPQAQTDARAGEEAVCRIADASRPLPADVGETSGLARGIQNPDLLWTHNDSGGEPEIFALGLDGSLKSRVRITGAQAIDWEDIESGRCGNAGCLYVADIGDNAGRRSSVTIYEIVEPVLPAREQQTQRTMHARYADGPQDAEALFRLPSGELYVITKGRQKTIKLYRLEAGSDASTGVLQPIREIAPQPHSELDRVTAATASPDGRWIAMRTYATLYLYRTEDLLEGNLAARTFALGQVAERQGESITLDNDGTVWLTSEAENPRDLPTIARLSCTLR
jgi:hypothetical protein